MALDIEVFAENYRGFKELHLSLDKTTFLTGDNSSGKSSVLFLLNYIFSTGLRGTPALDKSAVFDRYDFFSPYFNNADVTVGFRIKQNASYSGRFVTISQSKTDKKAIAIRVTWFKDDKYISFCNLNNNIRFKSGHLSKADLERIETIKEIHHSDDNYTAFERIPSEVDPLSNTDLLFYLFVNHMRKSTKREKKGEKKQSEWMEWFIFSKADLPKSRLTDPIRKPANRLYEAELETDTEDSNFVSSLSTIEKSEDKDGLKLIKDFGKKSKLFDSISAKNMNSNSSVLYLSVELEKNGKKLFLDQLGTGVAQVLPIIVEAAIVKKNKAKDIFLLLQQPELHLHPIAQAELGSFFYQMANEGLNYVIETHSDFLIDRFRTEIKENAQKVKKTAQIIFCESNAEGNHYHTIRIDKNGELENAPEIYKDFFVKELIRTM